jgi:aldose 1-epimerase
MFMQKEYFGKTSDNQEAYLFTLSNDGIRVMISNYGGRMVQLWLPDRNGHFDDVIMGFDTLDSYLQPNHGFGALIGRYANRIANASFTLNGKKYFLNPNIPPHHLHGGSGGFDNKLWDAEETNDGKLKLTLTSPDGDQGYPGNLRAEVVYSLSSDNRLSIAYKARTDAPTIVNLTNHCYFNLKGHNTGTILGHHIRIDADAYLPTNAAGIPSGRAESVAGTPFDLREMTSIGSRINMDHVQMREKSGFDHHYFFAEEKERSLRQVCEIHEPESGRTMELWTTKPGMQFYISTNIKGDSIFTGKGGYVYRQYCGFCLETQYPPDSPNNPTFPSVVLHPGETYQHETVFVFTV